MPTFLLQAQTRYELKTFVLFKVTSHEYIKEYTIKQLS